MTWSGWRLGVILTFILMLAPSSPIAMADDPPPASADSGPPLRALADARGLRIGAAVLPQPLASEAPYAETLARELNLVTPENAMKFGPIHPNPDRYAFRDADAIVAFATAHNMAVRGHTLVWHNQLPRWVTDGNFSRDELITILREHILAVVGHYRGQVTYWDVVNEAVEQDGSLRDTIWLRGIGPEYIEMAFRWAREADPDARLIYNDYGGEGINRKSDAIFNLVRDLRERDVPVDGVGLQMHVSVRSAPKPDEVLANMNRLADLGLEVHITEMDVKIQDGTGNTDERLTTQAGIYRDMLGACLTAARCPVFSSWGFTDSHSWIPIFTNRPDAPLIFDEGYQPKPAYHAIHELLGAP